MNIDTIDLRAVREKHYWDFVRVSHVGGITLQTTIHLDGAYKSQSSAAVSVWTATGWVRISGYSGTELHRDHDLPNAYNATITEVEAAEDFEVVANILENSAIKILSYNKENN